MQYKDREAWVYLFIGNIYTLRNKQQKNSRWQNMMSACVKSIHDVWKIWLKL